jgi:hypothetical protein
LGETDGVSTATGDLGNVSLPAHRRECDGNGRVSGTMPTNVTDSRRAILLSDGATGTFVPLL